MKKLNTIAMNFKKSVKRFEKNIWKSIDIEVDNLITEINMVNKGQEIQLEGALMLGKHLMYLNIKRKQKDIAGILEECENLKLIISQLKF